MKFRNKAFHRMLYRMLHVGKTNKRLGQLMQYWMRRKYYCEIPYNVHIGEGTRFAHAGFGTVINGNCIIGKDCFIQHGVTIGERKDPNRCPKIGNGVFIGCRAIILGDITIGDRAKIGAGALVLHDVAVEEVYTS